MASKPPSENEQPSDESVETSSVAHELAREHWYSLLPAIGYLRASTAVVLGVSLLIFFLSATSWYTPLDLTVGLSLQIAVIFLVAQRLARVPKSATPVEINNVYMAEIARDFGLRPPRLLQYGSTRGTQVRLRGWGENVSVLVSPAVLVQWYRTPRQHIVQFTHELAHHWCRDIQTYYVVTALSAYSLALSAILALIRPLSLIQYVVLAGIAVMSFLATRGYLRFREHAADMVTAYFLGSAMREFLPESGAADRGILGRLIRTHPSPSRRQAVLANPNLLFVGISWCMFGLGLAVALLSNQLQGSLLLEWPTAQMAGRVIAIAVPALIAAAVLGPALRAFEIYGPEHPRIRWYYGLLAGTICFQLLTDIDHVTTWMLGIYAAILLIAARSMVLVSMLLGLLLYDRSDYSSSWWVATAFAIWPTLIWCTIVVTWDLGYVHELASWLGRLA